MAPDPTIAEAEIQFINTPQPQVKLTRLQQKQLDEYLRQNSTTQPILGSQLRVLFELAELIKQDGWHQRWLKQDQVTDIAVMHCLKHRRTPLDHSGVEKILKAGFGLDEKISIGPYEWYHQRTDIVKRNKSKPVDEYHLRVNQAELQKHKVFLAQVKGQKPSEADAAKQP